MVGKDLSKKAEAQSEYSTESYTGFDLKVGGDGMKGFYNQIVPSVAREVAKRLGGETTTLDMPKTGKQTAFIITPAMRSKILGEGMPLFSRKAQEDEKLEALLKQYAGKDGAPTEAELKEAVRQYRTIEAKYFNKDGTEKPGALLAPNGERSNLNKMQWIQVRTPNFKRWFGDWETIVLINEVKAMPALDFEKADKLADKKAIEDTFRDFGLVENNRDKRKVTFPVSMAGKIVRHKGFDVTRIAGSFDKLFAESVPILTEPEILQPGHKQHINITAYHHYVSKFQQGGSDYYVRFTVQQMLAKQGKPVTNVAHSSFVSEVAIYDKSAASNTASFWVIDPGLTGEAAPLDKKLSQWFDSVNPSEVSKVTDSNGEPLVVYHGTDIDLNEYDPKLAGKKGDRFADASFFSNSRQTASGYAINLQGNQDYMDLVEKESDLANIYRKTAVQYGVESENFKAIGKEYDAIGQRRKALQDKINKNEVPTNGSVVYPSFLAIRNPTIQDANGRHYRYVHKNVFTKAVSENADGVIVRNVIDSATTESKEVADVYAVFNPNQIKSATSNTGTFKPNSGNIKFSIAPKDRSTPLTAGIASPADSKAVVEKKNQSVITWLKDHIPDEDTLIYGHQDRMVDMLREVEKVQKAGGTLDEVINPYLAEELYSQRAASRVDEFHDKHFKPLLKALHDHKIAYDDFQRFLHARHAPSRNKVMAERNPSQAIIDKGFLAAQQAYSDALATQDAKAIKATGRELKKWQRAQAFKGTEAERLSLSGMSDAEAKALIDGLPLKQRKVMMQLGEQIDNITNATLDLLVDYGMETPASVAALKAQWEHYIPLHRDEAHPDTSATLSTGGGRFGHPATVGLTPPTCNKKKGLKLRSR